MSCTIFTVLLINSLRKIVSIHVIMSEVLVTIFGSHVTYKILDSVVNKLAQKSCANPCNDEDHSSVGEAWCGKTLTQAHDVFFIQPACEWSAIILFFPGSPMYVSQRDVDSWWNCSHEFRHWCVSCALFSDCSPMSTSSQKWMKRPTWGSCTSRHMTHTRRRSHD